LVSSKKISIAFTLFFLSLIVYYFIYPNPRNWYNHYYHQALSFLNLQLDVPSLPSFYQDKIIFNNKTYLPFPPMPALIQIPFIKANPDLTQQQISILIASLNSAFVYLLLTRLTQSKKAIVLTIFYSFGTVAFWSAVVGTTWYFAHTVAVFFLILAFHTHFSKKHLLSGLFLALAALSRLPVIFAALFFILELKNQKKTLFKFLIALSPALLITLILNYLKFGNLWQTGYQLVYQGYVSGSYPYTIIHQFYPNFPYFHHLDPRNIPLHLFTFLVFPPLWHSDHFSPSPYGMGILFTSPLLLLALWPRFKNNLQQNLYLSALLIALIDFMHYMQGWVQFGYRFALDFMLFLIILLALKITLTRLNVALIIISIIINFWGVRQAILLGW